MSSCLSETNVTVSVALPGRNPSSNVVSPSRLLKSFQIIVTFKFVLILSLKKKIAQLSASMQALGEDPGLFLGVGVSDVAAAGAPEADMRPPPRVVLFQRK